MIILYLGAVNFVMFRLLFSDIDAIFHYLKMGEQCGGSLGDFISVDFGSYMDPYAFYCHLLRCAKPLCYGSAYCSNLCLCVSRIHIAVSKLLIENPSCYFDAFGKFLIFLNQVSCFVIMWDWLLHDVMFSCFRFIRFCFHYSFSRVQPRSLFLALPLLLRVSLVWLHVCSTVWLLELLVDLGYIWSEILVDLS